jgi:predicted permease
MYIIKTTANKTPIIKKKQKKTVLTIAVLALSTQSVILSSIEGTGASAIRDNPTDTYRRVSNQQLGFQSLSEAKTLTVHLLSGLTTLIVP